MPVRSTPRLDKRLTLQTASETPGADGAPVVTWSTFATCQAQVEALQGREYVGQGHKQGDRRYRIVIRNRAGVTPKMRATCVIRGTTRTFELEHVEDDLRYREPFLMLHAIERGL